MEVLKSRVPLSGPVEVVAKRQLIGIDESEAPVLGCPMLTRTRMGMPFARGRNIPRCALAWAVHSEAEAGLCMETPDPALCWKAHPEQVEVIRERIAERAAD